MVVQFEQPRAGCMLELCTGCARAGCQAAQLSTLAYAKHRRYSLSQNMCVGGTPRRFSRHTQLLQVCNLTFPARVALH